MVIGTGAQQTAPHHDADMSCSFCSHLEGLLPSARCHLPELPTGLFAGATGWRPPPSISGGMESLGWGCLALGPSGSLACGPERALVLRVRGSAAPD